MMVFEDFPNIKIGIMLIYPTFAMSIRHTCGIDNPGYIPEHPGSDDEQDRGGGGGGGSGRSNRSESWNREQGQGPPLSRPRSTEGAWLEGSFTGPRQHYRAQETYFDCEFYIYGHKYQSE